MSGFTDIPIASGASSSRSAGDAAVLACGNPDGARLLRPEIDLDSPHAVAFGCAPDRARDDARRAVALAAVADLVSIHISLDTATLLALLAAEHGESLGCALARLVVDGVEQCGGISRVGRTASGRKPDRGSAPVRRPAGAPAGETGDAAREAKGNPNV